MSADVFAAADGPKRRLGHAPADRYRRVFAERTGWPAGAVEECERLEGQCRGWEVWWFADWPVDGFERQAGFYAWRSGDTPLVKTKLGGYEKRRELYGATGEALGRALAREP